MIIIMKSSNTKPFSLNIFLRSFDYERRVIPEVS